MEQRGGRRDMLEIAEDAFGGEEIEDLFVEGALAVVRDMVDGET